MHNPNQPTAIGRSHPSSILWSITDHICKWKIREKKKAARNSREKPQMKLTQKKKRVKQEKEKKKK